MEILDRVFEVLSEERRRYALYYLEQADGPVPVEELIEQIAERTDASIASISHALSQLQERDCVQLLVEEERRKGRVYGLTESGQEVWEHLQEEQMLQAKSSPSGPRTGRNDDWGCGRGADQVPGSPVWIVALIVVAVLSSVSLYRSSPTRSRVMCCPFELL